MKLIGLLMTSHDEDILRDVLDASQAAPDALYVLDGSDSRDHLPRRLDGYWRDQDVPYEGSPRDGWRQWLLEHATADWGPDNWFVLLHGDEVWPFDPRELIDQHPGADGFVVRLPCYFPRDPWQPDVPALRQLRWSLNPGWPEFRMFRGGRHVRYDTRQHFNVTPQGIDRIAVTDRQVRHYPYRSPESQHARAKVTFDPDNYSHVREGRTVWDDTMIARWQRQPCWRELGCD